jgi:polyhydroxybutyrate depolymerase
MMRHSFVAILMLVALTACGSTGKVKAAAPAAVPVGVTEGGFRYDGDQRSYLLHVPPSYDGQRPVPLVLVFHGGFGNADMAVSLTEMNPLADRRGFIVAYPDGTGRAFGRFSDKRTWNAGRCCGIAEKKDIDDVGFTAELIRRLRDKYRISDVYATGISNGAMMVYRLACEIPEQLAGVAAVSGPLALERCAPKSPPPPVLHIHGSKDDNVPFEGGMGPNAKAGVEHYSVPHTLQVMRRLHNCADSAAEKSISKAATEASYACQSRGPVTLIKIEGGGHTWPGGHDDRKNAPYGGDISASEAIVDFFLGRN